MLELGRLLLFSIPSFPLSTFLFDAGFCDDIPPDGHSLAFYILLSDLDDLGRKMNGIVWRNGKEGTTRRYMINEDEPKFSGYLQRSQTVVLFLLGVDGDVIALIVLMN